MGLVIVDPKNADVELKGRSALVVAPTRASEKTMAALSEWAAATQAPIFALPRDVERLEDEGFGSYRFLKLDGYREVDFQGGTIEFFPARTGGTQKGGLRIAARQVLAQLGWLKSEHFHVRIWPDRERPVLILAHAQIDAVEATVLRGSERPSMAILLDAEASTVEIERLSRVLGAPVRRRSEISEVVETVLAEPSPERLRRREIGLWAANGNR